MRKWKPTATQKELIRTLEAELKAKEPKKCIACNGSGRYDTTGGPRCGACGGTGTEQKAKYSA